MSSGKTLFDKLEPQKVWEEKDWRMAEFLAQQLFNPTSPVEEDKLFSGRIEQVDDLIGVIYQRGAHAILFGERGVGKSSLARTIQSKIPKSIVNLKFRQENCGQDDTFFPLWSKMLWDFDYEGRAVSEYLKDETRPFVVHKVLEILPKDKQYIFIFDEFDRIASKETKIAMADLIKQFSDFPRNITIVIVGVGFSVEELFGLHPSIQRCCRQISMPRMDSDELTDIIVSRYEKIGIKASPSLISRMTSLSQGLPGYAHLLGMEAALSAIRRKSREVEEFDFTQAIKESERGTHEHIVEAYNKAVYSAKDNLYKEVLLACAMAHTNERGKFSASGVKEQLSKILNRRIEISYFARHLASFCDEKRGAILRKTGKPKGFQYQFIDAPLQPYVIMAGKRDKLI